MKLRIHTLETAPDVARDILEKGQSTYGFIPNLWAAMAESPALLKAYTTAYEIYQNETSLTPQEQHIVALTISERNGCDYCKAAHSTIGRMVGLDDNTLARIIANQPVADAKQEALRIFAQNILKKQGQPSIEDLKEFQDAGYSNQHVLDVILGVGVKTLSNYTNHIAHTPIDQAFSNETTK